jgi:hypothetical protein
MAAAAAAAAAADSTANFGAAAVGQVLLRNSLCPASWLQCGAM